MAKKITSKVLSITLAMLMLSTLLVSVSAETVVHEIGASEKTIIPAVEYVSTTNTSGTRDYGFNGVKPCIPITTSESVNLGSGGGLNNIYRINVAEAGQYRLTALISRQKQTISAEVCVVSDGEVIARTISSVGTTGTTNAHPVTTSTFNLSAGVQDLHVRIHGVNDDPTLYSDGYLFFFYLELEKVDSIVNCMNISETSENEIDIENYFFADEGIVKNSDSAVISANKKASFYLDTPTDGEYAVSLRYKAADDTLLHMNSSTMDIYKDSLVGTNGEYLIQTISVAMLKSGENKIELIPSKDLEIDKIYIRRINDESALDDINGISTEDELKTAVELLETKLGIYLSNWARRIFYTKPAYNRLVNENYNSVKDFVKKYNEAILYEYENPWATLYIDGVKKTELSTGDIKVTVSTGYLPKGSTMIIALYENLADNIKTLQRFASCEEISEDEYDFLLGETEIKPESSYTLKFFYWADLDTITPIEVFDRVYEEIYVSTAGRREGADGTAENPYPTIQAALEKVKRINDYQWGDIIINVEDGMYTLDETLVINEEYSGKNGYNVIIRGENGKQPTISGGRRVLEWTQSSGNIWKAPLSGVDYVRNLYINGYPAVVARSDRRYDTAEAKREIPTTIYNVGSGENTVTTQDIAMTKESTGIDAALVEKVYAFSMTREELGIDFEHPVGMEFVWPYTFEHHITPVTGYEKDDDEITFYMNEALLGMREQSVFKTGAEFYLQNAKELIDKPGEFCYDKEDGYIYYYPYDYEDMTKADVYIGNVEGMVKVAGSSPTSKVENITIENLAFRYGAYNFISKYGYIGSQTDGILVPFEWSEGTIGYKAQFEVNNADNINIKDCEFACLGSGAVSMIDSVSNSEITGNIIRDISGTGIRIGHPTHNRQREGIEVCSNINITNNVIRRIAGETFNNCGITVYYEKYINILHNDIENVPYSGISIGWGWGSGAAYNCSDIDVSYNKIQSVMNTLHDGGGIYTLGPLKNTKISNNYLKGHGSRSGGMIYNDNGSAFIEVYNNVILDAVLSQAITNANDVNSPTKNLTYYNNYSDVGTHPQIADGKGINFEDHIIVTGEGESLNNANAKAIYQNAGLESEYMDILSKNGINLPNSGRTISSELPEPAPSDVVVLSSTEYDKATSTEDLEMITYADGIGVALNYREKLNYKLNIPKSGYYKIILRAIGDSSGDDGVKISGDAKNVTMRVYSGWLGGVSSNLAIANSTFYNYRVCTAYFDEGVKNLTISPSSSGNRLIIKEVHYANLLQEVKSSGVNIIPLKNYYKVSGLDTNTYENAQYEYKSTGAQYYVKGPVTNGGNKTTTLTYKLNVKEAGTYKVTAASWVGANSPVTYQILLDGTVKAEGTTKTYPSLKKSEDTQLSDLTLPAGEVELVFKATSNGPNYSIMYYFTLEKK